MPPARPPRLRAAQVTLVICTGLLIAACGAVDSVPAPDAPGPFAVGHSRFTVLDSERGDRQLAVRVWYPAEPSSTEDRLARYWLLEPILFVEAMMARPGLPFAEGAPRPLVVFSHGSPAFSAQSPGLTETLASHGFIVAAPDHTGNTYLDPSDSAYDAARNRVPDISLVIDEVLRRNALPDDLLEDRVDAASIAVVGNSFGGSTAVGAAAGWVDAPADPRVQAIVPISAVVEGGDGWSFPTFGREQLAAVTLPVLLMGGTEDENVPIRHNEFAFDALTEASALYRVDIAGANHYNFADTCGFINAALDAGLTLETLVQIAGQVVASVYAVACTGEGYSFEESSRLTNLYTVSFLRRHLLGDLRYGQFLTEDFAATEPDIIFARRAP